MRFPDIMLYFFAVVVVATRRRLRRRRLSRGRRFSETVFLLIQRYIEHFSYSHGSRSVWPGRARLINLRGDDWFFLCTLIYVCTNVYATTSLLLNAPPFSIPATWRYSSSNLLGQRKYLYFDCSRGTGSTFLHCCSRYQLDAGTNVCDK